jgi:hypothetical protein
MMLFFVRRGIPAQPILNGYCGSYEPGMPRSMINYPAFNYEVPVWDNSTTTSTSTSTSTSMATSTATAAATDELHLML